MIPVIYNYLSTNYMPKPTNMVHKRSELRNLYDNMVRMNKVTPLYKINLTEDNQTFSIGVKSTSLQLIETMTTMDSTKMDSIFDHQIAYSENPNSAEVILVAPESKEYPAPFELEVISLAQNQVNTSLPIPIYNAIPAVGAYSFSISLGGKAYKFQYNIRENTNNEDTMEKLVRFINKSNLGVEASITYTAEDIIQMNIASMNSGSNGEPIFTLADVSSPKNSPGLVEYYGLNQIFKSPENAVFKINGEIEEASSNHFMMDQVLQINLISPSEEPYQVGYMPDSQKIIKEMEVFQKEYNDLIDLANDYNSKQGMSQKLLWQLNTASFPYKNELEAVGISFETTGKMILNESLASQSIESREMNTLFTSKGFLPRLKEQLTTITMNPMNYVDKTLVTYPNTNRPVISSVYVSSIYSGLFFNYYC